MSSYKELRDEVWPFDWGIERQAVRDYLKREWKRHVSTQPVGRDTVATTRQEADDILEWWWRNRYGQQGSRSLYNYPANFGTWLLREYRANGSVDQYNNTGYGRF